MRKLYLPAKIHEHWVQLIYGKYSRQAARKAPNVSLFRIVADKTNFLTPWDVNRVETVSMRSGIIAVSYVCQVSHFFFSLCIMEDYLPRQRQLQYQTVPANLGSAMIKVFPIPRLSPILADHILGRFLV